MTKTAVVVGGSVSGLMHGIILRKNGYHVTILEQEEFSIRKGFDAGMNAGPHVVQFLEKHDRANRPYAIPISQVHVVKQDGSVAWKTTKPMALTSWGLLMRILRAAFDGQFSINERDGPLPTFKEGIRVTGMIDKGDKVHIQYDDLLGDTNSHTMEADIVIAADGSNSSIRSILLPDAKRTYAGYVSWRGTVREDLIEESHRRVLEGHATFHRQNPGQILCYIVPTDEGELKPGKRLFNWVWYEIHPQGSQSLREIMTDINDTTHHGTVPRGLVHPEVWDRQRRIAQATLPPYFASLVENTKAPFVTKIHSVVARKGVFFGGKLFLVGDALAGFRPHAGEATNQAAYHAELLDKVVQGIMTRTQWEHVVLRHAYRTELWSVVLGSFGLSLKLALVQSVCRYILLLVRQMLGLVC